MKCKILAGSVFMLLGFSSFSQTKTLVIMGSSTAAGWGATNGINGDLLYDSSWAARVTRYFNQNSLDGRDTVVENIARATQTSYHQMPTGYIPPPGRPNVDQNTNVTKALSFNPDVVIVNLPTNDAANGYAKKEYMDNLRTISNTIKQTGALCYIATVQPKLISPLEENDKLGDTLITLVDSIKNNFGIYAIDFWTDLVVPGTYLFKSEVFFDGTHVNNLGHTYLSQRVIAKQIFLGGVLPIKLKDFNVSLKNDAVTVQWETELEDNNTRFDIERSADNSNFTIVHSARTLGSDKSRAYSWIDPQAISGNSFYRLKITEPDGNVIYSAIKNIKVNLNKPAIGKLIIKNSQLSVELNNPEKVRGHFSIFNFSGALLFDQPCGLAGENEKIVLSINNFPKGTYVIQINYVNGIKLSKQFMN